MCKIMTISGVRAGLEKKLLRFVRAATPGLTEHDSDGFGYAAVNAEGLYGERWLDVKQAWKRRPGDDATENALLASMGGAVRPVNAYSSFGNARANDLKGTTSIILHGRYSTNSISMQNTHPFALEDTALIHNGIINNQPDLKNTVSTCDSECILHLYRDHDVAAEASRIQRVADALSGYYACAVFARDPGNGQYILDVFKDDRAELVFACIPELGNARVFCTTKDILVAACKRAGFRPPKVYLVSDGYLVRFDAATGEVVRTLEFDCTGASWVKPAATSIKTSARVGFTQQDADGTWREYNADGEALREELYDEETVYDLIERSRRRNGY